MRSPLSYTYRIQNQAVLPSQTFIQRWDNYFYFLGQQKSLKLWCSQKLELGMTCQGMKFFIIRSLPGFVFTCILSICLSYKTVIQLKKLSNNRFCGFTIISPSNCRSLILVSKQQFIFLYFNIIFVTIVFILSNTQSIQFSCFLYPIFQCRFSQSSSFIK